MLRSHTQFQLQSQSQSQPLLKSLSLLTGNRCLQSAVLPAAAACQLIRRSNFYDIIKQQLMAMILLARSSQLALAWRHLPLPFMCSLQT